MRLTPTTIACAALAVGLFAWWWDDAYAPRKYPKRFGTIVDNAIYRSGQVHGDLIEQTLRLHDIRVVIDMTGPQPEAFDQQREIDAADRLGIEHRKYPLAGDGTGDPYHYVLALERLITATRHGEPALVHCSAGSQRTGGMIAMYRMFVQNTDPKLIVYELQRYDWKPDRDRILVEYLDAHTTWIAEQLVQRGVLEQMPTVTPLLPYLN